MSESIKIAITGGPSGGKTTLIEALKKDLGSKCAVVPETASILYRGGFPRYKEKVAVFHVQKAIYYTQRELEDLICAVHPQALIVCDRGSLDGIAYWPDSEENFFKIMNTTKSQELSRYQWVIHLETASVDFYDTSNPIRTETFQEAWDLNNKVKKAWDEHPRRIIIPHNEDFISKMTTAVAVIRAILAHKSSDEIKKDIIK